MNQVFLVSSLNTHVSILVLHVHNHYLQYLNEGTFPPTQPANADWRNPTLERTRWFDLFDINDRLELMRVLWGVISYLTR